jgi:hypothetical protein
MRKRKISVREIPTIRRLCGLTQLQVLPTSNIRFQELLDVDWPEDVFTLAQKEAAEVNRIAARYQSRQATSTDYSKHDTDKDRSWWSHIAQQMEDNVHIWRLAVRVRVRFLCNL